MAGLENVDEGPKSNGLKKNRWSPPSFVRTSGHLRHFSRSKKDSLRRLGSLFRRVNGHVTETRLKGPPSQQQLTYSISDGILQPPTSWRDTGSMSTNQITSKMYLHTLGVESGDIDTNQTQLMPHKPDSETLLLRPPGLHGASSLTASSSRLLSSSEDLCQGFAGPCDSLDSSYWEQEESITTQL